jgi:hypothetical protein
MENKHDGLPLKFDTWAQLLRQFKDVHSGVNVCQYTEYLPDGTEKVYRFTLNEIKSHALDELLECVNGFIHNDGYLGMDGYVEAAIYIDREFISNPSR